MLERKIAEFSLSNKWMRLTHCFEPFSMLCWIPTLSSTLKIPVIKLSNPQEDALARDDLWEQDWCWCKSVWKVVLLNWPSCPPHQYSSAGITRWCPTCKICGQRLQLQVNHMHNPNVHDSAQNWFSSFQVAYKSFARLCILFFYLNPKTVILRITMFAW